jgi:2'-5' RNA ligase
MVHSVELLFDSETDAAVRRLWDDLTDAGVRSLAASTSPSNRPHVTLSVAEHMDETVNEALRPLLRLVPFPCTIGAPMLFGRGPFTLVRLVIPSAELLGLQAEVHEVCLPHMSPGPLPHSEPGHWTPHVTLARRVAEDKLADALSLRRTSRDRHATAVALRHWDGNNRVEYPIDT